MRSIIGSIMNTAFKADPTKLNPKFEGYKLDPFDEREHVKRTSLYDVNVNLDAALTDSRIGFRDLQARIRQSHLYYGFSQNEDSTGTAFYVDADYCLHMIVYDKLSKDMHIYTLVQLIKPLGAIPSYAEPEKNVPVDPQSPSVVAISSNLVLVSNGVGHIELIKIIYERGLFLGVSVSIMNYEGTGNDGISPVPCVLLTARLVDGKIMMVVYNRANSAETKFNIATLSMDLPSETTTTSQDVCLQTLHIQIGPEVPAYCVITPSGQRVIFGAENKYNKVTLSDEQSDTAPMEEVIMTKSNYTWNQEGTDISVQFDVPMNTSKSDISCKFVTDHLSLIVKNGENNILSYPFRRLWGNIIPDECIWTLDSHKLTLYITKADENTRWPQLFDKDDGVLEDITDHALSEITQRLAKFTSDKEDADPSKIVHTSQHPAATDMDEDIDESTQPVIFSVYDTLGNVVNEFSTGNQKWIGSSYLSQNGLPTVCLQMDVDGLIYSFTEEEDLSITIKHIATFDAFAFVQASKRDARFIHHDPYLSFVSIIESSRNAYIYYHHSDKRILEKQTLIDLTKGEDVNIIGVQLIMKNILLVLTESHSVIIDLSNQ